MYGLRLRIEYKDINEVLTQVNIYQDGYSGSADVRYANAGLRVQWGDESNPDPLIYGSSCTLYFDAEYDFEYLYLFSADAKKHKVEIKKNGSVFWVGFIEPDSWSEPMHATPYPVQCTAYDGLGFLKDVEYEIHEDVRTSIADIAEWILQQTGLNLQLILSHGYAEAGFDEYGTHLIDDTIYDGLTCYEVLEQLYQGHIILQRNGEWYIIDWETLGTFESEVYEFEGTPALQISPGLKKVTVTYDLGYRKNLATNGSFEEFNKELAVFESWENINITPAQEILNNDGDKYIFLPGSQTNDYLQSYVKKSIDILQTNSIVNISLKYAIQGTKNSAYPLIAVYLRATTAIYLLMAKTRTSKNIEWEWIEVPIESPMELISAAIRMKKTDETIVEDGETVPAYEPIAELIPAWSRNKITDHFEEFRASVAGIPANGTLEIYLSRPMTITQDAAIQGVCYTGVAIELLDEEEQEYPTEITFDVVGDIKNNYVPEEIELVNGDYQANIDNHRLIYKGGFTRQGGLDTTGWKLALTGSTFYPYVEFIGRVIAAKMLYPRQQMKARLMDVIPPFMIVLSDPNNPGYNFIETGITYDDRYQSIEGSFTEIKPLDIDTPDVDGQTTYAFNIKMPEIAMPVPINIEERVTIRDRLGAGVSMPGYLYENDFEIREPLGTETPDGLTRLQIKKRAVTPYNLSYDASTVQFAVTSVFAANADGDPNKVSISAGKIISHNFNALDKDHRIEAIES